MMTLLYLNCTFKILIGLLHWRALIARCLLSGATLTLLAKSEEGDTPQIATATPPLHADAALANARLSRQPRHVFLKPPTFADRGRNDECQARPTRML